MRHMIASLSHRAILAAGLVTLAGCTLSSGQTAALTSAAATAASAAPAPTGTLATIVTDGQLFCAQRGAVVALADLAGAPVIAEGASSAYVAAACAVIGAVPVAPPATGTTVPVVAAAVPTT